MAVNGVITTLHSANCDMTLHNKSLKQGGDVDDHTSKDSNAIQFM